MEPKTPNKADPMTSIDRSHLLLGLSAAAAITSMWLPWLRSGATTRTSFEVFRAAQIFGFDQLTPLRVLWYVLPVLVICCFLLLSSGLVKTGAIGLLLAGLLYGLAGLLAARTAGVLVGSALGAVAGLLMVVQSGLSLKRNRRSIPH